MMSYDKLSPEFLAYRAAAVDDLGTAIMNTVYNMYGLTPYSAGWSQAMSVILGFENATGDEPFLDNDNPWFILSRSVAELSAGWADAMLGAEVPLLGAFAGTLSMISGYAGGLESVIELLPALENYLYAIQIPRLRQYWSLYQAGYINKNELLAFSGAHNMLHFYKVIGCDPSFIGPIKEQRQNGMITDAQMVQRLALNNVAEVDTLFGQGWRIAVNLNDKMRASGIDTTFEGTKAVVEAVMNDIHNMTTEQVAVINSLISKAEEISLFDLEVEDYASIVNEALLNVRDMGEEDNQQHSFVAEGNVVPILTANVLNVMNSEKRKEKSSFGREVDVDFIESNVAVALRQVNMNHESVGDFSIDSKVSSSFGSISFASPFEQDMFATK